MSLRRRLVGGRSLVLGAVVVMAAPHAEARAQNQATQVITSEVVCRRCALQISLGPRLGQRDGPGAIATDPSGVAVDSRGRFFISQFAGPMPLVFAPDGRFLAVMGREGSGPGELRHPTAMYMADGDTIWIVERRNGRVSLFGPELNFVRTIPAPYPAQITFESGFVVLPDGRAIANVQARSREQAGYPLHVLGRDMQIERSFGSDGTLLPRSSEVGRRLLTRDEGGGVWSATVTRYLLEHWNGNADRVAAFERRADWFAPHQGSDFQANQEPLPQVMDIRMDSQGRLWTISLVKDPQWRSGVVYDTTARSSSHAARAKVGDVHRYFDTIIEVIDARRGELLVSQRVPDAIYWLVGDGLIAGRVEDEDGRYFVQTWRVVLQSR